MYAGSAHSGGFATPSQTASAMGNALAGGAASAEDAGAMWFNPAAMPELGSGLHLVMAGHRIRPSFKYHDTGSTGAFAAPGTGDGGDGGHAVYVPQAFLVRSTGGDWWIGVAQNGPFGLETEYDSGWRGRLIAVKSESRAINLNPAVGYRVSPSWSVGLGLNLQRFDVKLERETGIAGRSKIDADDYAFGWNAGLMFKPDEHTRIGLAYRSRMGYKLEGTATFSASSSVNRDITAFVTLPESASLSVFSQLSSRWAVMADATWTRWNRLQIVAITPSIPLPASLGPVLLPALAFEWSNTVRVGAGVTYSPGNAWKLRAGIAYDPTPSNDATRTPQLPDQDRTFVSAGAQYNLGTLGKVDIAYMHQFVKDARVNVVRPPAGTLSGTFKNKVDIISIQHSITF